MPTLNRTFSSLFLLLAVLVCSAQSLSFKGVDLKPVCIEPPKSTGLSAVYVLPYVVGVTAEFETDSPAAVKWQKFSKLGAAYAQDVQSTVNSNASVLNNLEGDMGYVVSDGTTTSYFWIIDHSQHAVELESLTLSPSSECASTWLNFQGKGSAMLYYSITGAPNKVNREFNLTYRTLEFNSNTFAYDEIEHTEVLESLDAELFCPAHLCQTDFMLSGDRFLREWGEEASIISSAYDPIAVDAQTSATQTQREVENEVREEAALGGSAPVEVNFRAAVTDAALYHEWEFARDPEFNQTFVRYSDLEVTYTFREQGTTYVRLLAANASGGCEYQSETYQVYVGESSLKCPNAFSPGGSVGVNDEWKVSYKSIIEFDCQIFDRQGRKMAHLTDPSQGWDGKRAGKVVPAGAYFYTLRATGADGRKYKLSGSINIVGYKNNTSSSNEQE